MDTHSSSWTSLASPENISNEGSRALPGLDAVSGLLVQLQSFPAQENVEKVNKNYIITGIALN